MAHAASRSRRLLGTVVGLVVVATLAACSVPRDSAPPMTDAAVVSTSPVASPSLSPSETAPSPAASTSPASSPSASGVSAEGPAMDAALTLTVKGRSAKTGYERAQFGDGWIDVDRNGCDTRNDMLRLRLTQKEMSGGCKVLSGWLADPYTGEDIHFVRGGASEVDIDHIVALSDAWQKGAATWPYAKRVAFANDPLNLEPSDASANRQKGDGDAATWLPSNKAWRCDYVARQVAVKTKYGAWVTQAEQEAMVRVLATCPGQELPSPGDQPVIADNTGGPAPTPVATPTSKPRTADLDRDYGTCKAAIAAGKGPYVRGTDPEYDWYTDRDKDGIVCE